MGARGRIALLAVTAFAAAALLAFASAAPADPPPLAGPLTTTGHGFKDPSGRTVVLHGLFAVWKQNPLYPAEADDAGNPSIPSFTPADADLVQDLGVDAVRLAWYWEGLEPTQGTYSSTYLDGIEAVQDKLAARDIYTVLDSHQDQYDRIFGDKPGFPTWSALYDGKPVAPLSSDPGYAVWKFPLGYAQPATLRAFASLYANRSVGGEPLWQAYGDAWKQVAARFVSDPMVVGYDLMNEPFPAALSDTDPGVPGCSTGGCPAWDRDSLEPLFVSLARSVRQVDPTRPVFFEPSIFFNSGNPNGFTPPPADIRPVGLSFHNQCPTRSTYSITHDPSLIAQGHVTCPPIEAKTMHNADATAAQLGGPPLMTEVAPTADADTEGLNCLLERADYFQTGFTYGLSWSNPNKELRRLHSESAPGGDAPYKEMVLARVYPRAVAGDPESYSFDVRTGRFSLSYTSDPAVSAPTLISVPAGIQYPSGYTVTVTGGHMTSAPGADVVTIANDPGRNEVHVEIAPAAGDTTDRPSFPACALDPDASTPDTPPDAKPAAVSLGHIAKSLKSLRHGGLKVYARCDGTCSVTGSLRSGGREVAAGSAGREGAGQVLLKLRLRRGARHRLRGAERLRARIQIRRAGEATALGLRSVTLR